MNTKLKNCFHSNAIALEDRLQIKGREVLRYYLNSLEVGDRGQWLDFQFRDGKCMAPRDQVLCPEAGSLIEQLGSETSGLSGNRGRQWRL